MSTPASASAGCLTRIAGEHRSQGVLRLVEAPEVLLHEPDPNRALALVLRASELAEAITARCRCVATASRSMRVAFDDEAISLHAGDRVPNALRVWSADQATHVLPAKDDALKRAVAKWVSEQRTRTATLHASEAGAPRDAVAVAGLSDSELEGLTGHIDSEVVFELAVTATLAWLPVRK